MKKYFVILSFLISFSVFAGDESASVNAVPPAAEPPLVANIKISPDLGKTQCATQPGKDIVLSWQGVTDKRTNQAVATLKNRKKEEVDVKLALPIDSIIGDAVKTVFKNCGFEIKDKDAKGIETSVEVTEIYAGSKKGFFTGETDAKTAMTIHFKGIGATYDFNLGATKSDKRLKKKNVQQLEEVLTGLLDSTVVQIAESPTLYTELKKIHY